MFGRAAKTNNQRRLGWSTFKALVKARITPLRQWRPPTISISRTSTFSSFFSRKSSVDSLQSDSTTPETKGKPKRRVRFSDKDTVITIPSKEDQRHQDGCHTFIHATSLERLQAKHTGFEWEGYVKASAAFARERRIYLAEIARGDLTDDDLQRLEEHMLSQEQDWRDKVVLFGFDPDKDARIDEYDFDFSPCYLGTCEYAYSYDFNTSD
ncbi:hypothetical protein EHS25_001994 [Saitozyma podzolica]|uniref:Uncharacterized protein n=1 Tax=Saitozyma podzolica TaxID=1890683 RepID=A0A427YE63_9TREE|nr:hypothetical protein EHS25_001994 [Saitozyma podzolica]